MKNEPNPTGKELTTTLDTELMKRMYDWGGLYCHTVVCFNELLFCTEDVLHTFNEDVAKEKRDFIVSQGGKAGIRHTLIKFDGAFNLPQQQQTRI